MSLAGPLEPRPARQEATVAEIAGTGARDTLSGTAGDRCSVRRRRKRSHRRRGGRRHRQRRPGRRLDTGGIASFPPCRAGNAAPSRDGILATAPQMNVASVGWTAVIPLSACRSLAPAEAGARHDERQPATRRTLRLDTPANCDACPPLAARPARRDSEDRSVADSEAVTASMLGLSLPLADRRVGKRARGRRHRALLRAHTVARRLLWRP